jgi:hypothetical protein
MYVTHAIDGLPVQSFVPRPLLPSLSPGLIAAFRRIDAALSVDLHHARFAEACVRAVLRAGRSSPGQHARDSVENACAMFLQTRRCSEQSLVRLNARLVGAGAGVRTGPAWMGGLHPSAAWHVGSPPERLRGLLTALVRLQPGGLPASLLALISMLRLLQIHPFPDGNGRTARLYACWLVARALGPTPGFPTLVEALWASPTFDIHAASNEFRDAGSLEMLAEHTGRLVDSSARVFPKCAS